MTEVKFYETAEDVLLKFAVIIARYKDKWIFCKHKQRNTYEIPGGHREAGEEIIETAEYSNAIVHAFQKFRAPFSGKIVHIFPEQSAVI